MTSQSLAIVEGEREGKGEKGKEGRGGGRESE